MATKTEQLLRNVQQSVDSIEALGKSLSVLDDRLSENEVPRLKRAVSELVAHLVPSSSGPTNEQKPITGAEIAREVFELGSAMNRVAAGVSDERQRLSAIRRPNNFLLGRKES
jgi:hypothetical protein